MSQQAPSGFRVFSGRGYQLNRELHYTMIETITDAIIWVLVVTCIAMQLYTLTSG